jgi:hypothetical protein
VSTTADNGRGWRTIDLSASPAFQRVAGGESRREEIAPGVIVQREAGGLRMAWRERASNAASIVAPPPIVLRPASELIQTPKPTEWLVQGWIERGAFCMLNGAPASGKSFIALSWGLAIATGCGTWFGHATRRGPVIYLCGEGHRGAARRMRGWSDYHGIALDDAPLFVSDRAFPLDQAVEAHAAGEVIQAAADQCGMAPELIVFDTTARHFGGDENSAQEAGALIAHAAEMGARWGACVLLVHHSGHGATDRARGSSAFRAACDTEMLAKREGEDGRIVLRTMKAKDHDEPEPLALELVGLALPWLREDGTPDTTAILRPHAGGVPAPSESSAPKPAAGKNQHRALEVLRAMQDQQRRTLEAAGYDGAQARVLTAEWRDRCALDRNRWGETFKGLQERGAIEVDGPHVRLVEP